MRAWPAVRPACRAFPERVERFRARRRVGERINGTFLGWEGTGNGWVDFQGTKLLASMASLPQIGSRLHFVVKQLTPNIVLQEVPPSDPTATARLLRRLWSEQNKLEAALVACRPFTAPDLPDNPGGLGATFVAGYALWKVEVKQNTGLRVGMHRLQAALEPINAELAGRGLGRYLVLPWLSGRVNGAGLLLGVGTIHPEASMRGSSSPQAIFTCTHQLMGPLEVHFSLSDPHPGWVLYLDQNTLKPRTIASITKWLNRAFPCVGSGKLPFNGVMPLPLDTHPGLLPRLLLATAPERHRLHIQV